MPWDAAAEDLEEVLAGSVTKLGYVFSGGPKYKCPMGATSLDITSQGGCNENGVRASSVSGLFEHVMLIIPRL